VATEDESGRRQGRRVWLGSGCPPLVEAATAWPHAVLSRSRATGAKNFFSISENELNNRFVLI
jgi:hypothetical protein